MKIRVPFLKEKNRKKSGIRTGWIVVLIAALLLCAGTAGTISAQENGDETENTGETQKEISFDDLYGLRAAVKDGSIQDIVLESLVKDPEISYYKTLADECIALEQGKVDYVLTVKEQYSYLEEAYEDITAVEQLSFPCGEVGYIFAKDENGDALRAKIDAYIGQLEECGDLETLQEYWFTAGEKETVELPSTGKNGILTLASPCQSPPFIYIQDEKVTGFEAALLDGFCREYGYGIRVETTDLGGILPAVTSGKCDLGASSLMKTAEREEEVNFSKVTVQPVYTVLMRKDDAAALTGTVNTDTGSIKSFPEKIADSFRKTFLVEGRWKMILKGCAVTLLLTLLAGAIGIFLGLQIYKIRVSKYKVLRKLTGIFNSIMGGMPMVVLLMIFYYIIFGKVDIPAFAVAVIAFGLNCSSAISEIYNTCISSIDSGQTEAALALGYSPKAAFRRFILPQAMLRAMPLIRGQLVALLKGTAIVGFISIQDLTKMGDIIRSRTYEAFFPLIAIAILYFLFAWIIRVLIGRIGLRMDPVDRRRKRLEKCREEKTYE